MILVEHPGCCGRKNTGPELGHPVKRRLSHFFFAFAVFNSWCKALGPVPYGHQ